MALANSKLQVNCWTKDPRFYIGNEIDGGTDSKMLGNGNNSGAVKRELDYSTSIVKSYRDNSLGKLALFGVTLTSLAPLFEV